MFISLASCIRNAFRSTIRNFIVWTALKEKKLAPGASSEEYVKSLKIDPDNLKKTVFKDDAANLYEKITGKKNPVRAREMFEKFMEEMKAPRTPGKKPEPGKAEPSKVVKQEKEPAGEPKKLEVTEYEIEKKEPAEKAEGPSEPVTESPKGKKPRPDAFLSSDLKKAFGMGGIKAMEFGEEKDGLQELKVEFSGGVGKKSLKELIDAGVEGIGVRGPGSVWVSSKKLVLSMSDAIRYRAEMLASLDKDAGLINVFKDFIKSMNDAMAEKDSQLRMEEYLRKNPTIINKLEEMADMMETPKSAIKAMIERMKLAVLEGFLRDKLAGAPELRELENEAKKLLEEHKELIKRMEQQSIEKLIERVVTKIKEESTV